MKLHKGFTLIELMIVVAIIAILAAIAISQYQDYVIRSQVSEGAGLADGAKVPVGEFANTYGRFPSTNASAAMATATSIVGTYVTGVNAAGGPIVATFGGGKVNSNISGKTLTFSPVLNAGTISWVCKSINLKAKWCSSVCACSG